MVLRENWYCRYRMRCRGRITKCTIVKEPFRNWKLHSHPLQKHWIFSNQTLKNLIITNYFLSRRCWNFWHRQLKWVVFTWNSLNVWTKIHCDNALFQTHLWLESHLMLFSLCEDLDLIRILWSIGYCENRSDHILVDRWWTPLQFIK